MHNTHQAESQKTRWYSNGLSDELFRTSLVSITPYALILLAWFLAVLTTPKSDYPTVVLLLACLPIVTWAWASISGNVIMRGRVKEYQEYTRDLDDKIAWYRNYEGYLRDTQQPKAHRSSGQGMFSNFGSLTSFLSLMASLVSVLYGIVRLFHHIQPKASTATKGAHGGDLIVELVLWLAVLTLSVWAMVKGISGGMNDQIYPLQRRMAAYEARGRKS